MGIIKDKLNRPFAVKLVEAQGLVARNLRLYDDAVVSCSFGKDSMVVLHMARILRPDIPVVFNNTGVEFPQTIRLMKEVMHAWQLNLIVTPPLKSYWQCVEEYGFAPGSKNTSAGKQCCYWVKEKPMLQEIRRHRWTAVLDGVTAAESNQRRLRAVTHGACYPHKKWRVQKVHPIFWWTLDDVWEYTDALDLPVNALYREGSKRVGCMTCTAFKTWEAEMQRLSPKLLAIIRQRMGTDYQPALK